MRAHPDLPILDELGAEFAALIDAELAGVAGPAVHHERARLEPASPSQRRRARGARRVARRASVVLVLLCLVGSAALAARFAGHDDTPANTAPALLGARVSGWQLSAYRDRERLCLLFATSGEPVSRCGGEPRAGGLRATSTIAGDKRFLFGIAGPRVEAVSIRLNGFERTVATRPVADAEAAHESGVPTGARWFAIEVPGAAGEPSRQPATLAPLDAAGRGVGRPHVDCSLGVVGPACERQVRERAAVVAR